MNKIKLVFIGNGVGKNFIYKNETFRPYYNFRDNYSFQNLLSNLSETDLNKNFDYNEFEKANESVGNKKVDIYACINNEQTPFVVVSENKLYKWNMSDNVSILKEDELESPISNQYIIKTKNPKIKKIMENRGCEVLTDNKDFLIIKSQKLIFTKKFRDDLSFEGIEEEINKITTETGEESEIIINIKKGKQIGKFRGIKVKVIKENKDYIAIDFKENGVKSDLFTEVWYDENGKIKKIDKSADRVEQASYRFYHWRI